MKITINDIAFKVNPSQNQLFWDYVNSGEWESESFEIIDHFVSPGSYVIDVGCWIGPLSLYMAGKGAKVYAIDPDPTAYQEFTANLKLNPDLHKSIHTFNLAITAKSQEVKLYARRSYGASTSSTLHRASDFTKPIEVEGLGFSDFIKLTGHVEIDFIKMDIEGSEFQLLAELTQTLEKLAWPVLYISFHTFLINEFICRKKVKFKPLAIALLRLERMFKFRFFRSELVSVITEALALAKKYGYIYLDTGKSIDYEGLTAALLNRDQMNIVFTNEKWEKSY